MMNDPGYLDHNATTPLLPEGVDAMPRCVLVAGRAGRRDTRETMPGADPARAGGTKRCAGGHSFERSGRPDGTR
jgi:hypothetical protein